MTLIHFADLRTTPFPHSSELARKAAKGFARVWRNYRTWQARRSTTAILHGLDDRALKDIGLSRSEVESAVHDTLGERRRRHNDGWLRYGSK